MIIGKPNLFQTTGRLDQLSTMRCSPKYRERRRDAQHLTKKEEGKDKNTKRCISTFQTQQHDATSLQTEAHYKPTNKTIEISKTDISSGRGAAKYSEKVRKSNASAKGSSIGSTIVIIFQMKKMAIKWQKVASQHSTKQSNRMVRFLPNSIFRMDFLCFYYTDHCST